MITDRKNTAPDNLLYGRQPIWEALQTGQNIDKILLQKGAGGDLVRQILHEAQQQEIPVQQVPPETLDRICRKNHQGMVAFAALVPYYKLEDILAKTYDDGKIPLFLICDGITDVGNLGAIARTAACTNVNGIIIAAKGSAPINADAIKTSAGALHHIHICKVRFIDRAMQFLQENGIQIVASSLKTDKYIHEIDLTVPTAFVIGSEDKGVSPAFLKMADQQIKIPIIGNFDSYNVSVATGMLLYETTRQRMLATI